jgi:uncharacterized protein
MKLKDHPCGSNHAMTWDDEFRFSCHPEIDCYNTCCRDVTIFLDPLDVVRLRKALGINSSAFLETYTHKLVSHITGMPAVALRMSEDEGKTCPFVTRQGCSVYESRPYSCRLYPLDTEDGIEFKAAVHPDACHGLQESEEWTVERWRKEQGLYDYDDLDHNLKDVMNPDQTWDHKIVDSRMQDMILMALYDPDRFREFVFESSFLWKFNVGDDILEGIREDDVALLYFAGHWLRFVLFGKNCVFKIDKDYLQERKKEILRNKRL